ncbi:MAG: peptidylprolyl isomerase [Planctomycetes bacterium]|nr:peptidylprolyl isomerase [Planctomycetota bacterium]
MDIAKNAVVSFTYQVATAEGEEVDRSEAGHPLVYLHGHGQIISGLEAALIGHKAGDKVKATIAPEQAYGAHEPELDLQVPVEVFPEAARAQVKPGFRFKAEHPTLQGSEVVFTVHQVKEGQAYVSGNHPLAGKTLQFNVEIIEVRQPTADELSHGHAHGPGGHHHH